MSRREVARGEDECMKPVATTLYPFVPSGPRLARSAAFFLGLGVGMHGWAGGRCALRVGGAYFTLQDIDVPEWQRNQMVTFEVTDLDTYWSGLAAKDLEASFPGVKLRPPTDFAWGREVHVIDPGGVCWHVRQ